MHTNCRIPRRWIFSRHFRRNANHVKLAQVCCEDFPDSSIICTLWTECCLCAAFKREGCLTRVWSPPVEIILLKLLRNWYKKNQFLCLLHKKKYFFLLNQKPAFWNEVKLRLCVCLFRRHDGRVTFRETLVFFVPGVESEYEFHCSYSLVSHKNS